MILLSPEEISDYVDDPASFRPQMAFHLIGFLAKSGDKAASKDLGRMLETVKIVLRFAHSPDKTTRESALMTLAQVVRSDWMLWDTLPSDVRLPVRDALIAQVQKKPKNSEFAIRVFSRMHSDRKIIEPILEHVIKTGSLSAQAVARGALANLREEKDKLPPPKVQPRRVLKYKPPVPEGARETIGKLLRDFKKKVSEKYELSDEYMVEMISVMFNGNNRPVNFDDPMLVTSQAEIYFYLQMPLEITPLHRAA